MGKKCESLKKNTATSGYKNYKSVNQFPLHIQKLKRNELEAQYQELRQNYKSLLLSRSQLVRGRKEEREKFLKLKDNLNKSLKVIEQYKLEKQKLRQALSHSVETNTRLQQKGDELTNQVDNLTIQLQATKKLITDFESVYENIEKNKNVMSGLDHFRAIMKAANRLLNTDIKDLIPMKSAQPNLVSWEEESTANIGRQLLENK
ncbi:hypothetical protein [Okeania sp. SIO1I7]|uniref:hypothetical protein n=1 Tax=Okeania sp. SIO1I7 TaxID=2607772 RepID=UPI0013FC46DB|nr:hypothetical protein [Okeania sp. SIO1I7]NET28365.1 hypothetical protein [Okeania sp. SIO1I7]